MTNSVLLIEPQYLKALQYYTMVHHAIEQNMFLSRAATTTTTTPAAAAATANVTFLYFFGQIMMVILCRCLMVLAEYTIHPILVCLMPLLQHHVQSSTADSA